MVIPLTHALPHSGIAHGHLIGRRHRGITGEQTPGEFGQRQPHGKHHSLDPRGIKKAPTALVVRLRAAVGENDSQRVGPRSELKDD